MQQAPALTECPCANKLLSVCYQTVWSGCQWPHCNLVRLTLILPQLQMPNLLSVILNTAHMVRSPLNFFGSSFGSLTLELLSSATAWWGTGVTVALVTTVGVLVSEAVVIV